MDRDEDHQEWVDEDGEPLGTPDGYAKDGTPIYVSTGDEPPVRRIWHDRDAGVYIPVATSEDLEREFEFADFLWWGPGTRPEIINVASTGAPTEMADEAPWHISLIFWLVDGRYELSDFRIYSRSSNRHLRRRPSPSVLNASVLRAVNLGYLIHAGRRSLADRLRWHTTMIVREEGYRELMSDPSPNEWLEEVPRAIDRIENPPPRRRYDQDHWKHVAAVYDKAWRAGLPPTKAVAEHFDVTRSAAGKWVTICRKQDLLPPTVKTKPRGNPLTGDADGLGTED